MKPLRFGIVGCGAIAEFLHLPVASRIPEVEVVALADINLERARLLANRYSVRKCVDDYRMLPGDLDCVIIALPHHLHAPVAIEYLQRGISVLVEKPLALDVDEARQVLEVAGTTGMVLQVDQLYRFCNRARIVKHMIDGGCLGALKSFRLEGNFADINPMASGFAWRKEQSGGGTLMDIGSLVLDLLLWWLGRPVDVEYRDDSNGGVESECELSLVLEGAKWRIPGTVTLSRVRNLRNVVRIDGERFACEYGLQSSIGELRMTPVGWEQPPSFVLDAAQVPRWLFRDMFEAQLRNFVLAVHGREHIEVPTEDAVAALALIGECYRSRQPLAVPWEAAEQEAVGWTR